MREQQTMRGQSDAVLRLRLTDETLVKPLALADRVTALARTRSPVLGRLE